MHEPRPPPTPSSTAPLLHEFLSLVLQVLGQVRSSSAGRSDQEAKLVDDTQLALQLPTDLEQPGQ